MLWVELRVLRVFALKIDRQIIPQKKPSKTACVLGLGHLFQVLIILRPAGRFLTRPFPPGDFAARRLAAVILPPLLFLAIL
jgi:hypothetical protein